ncbi:MAG: hypothetical protein PHY47_02905 [Lachnospiraceae bacterium]|nr:hypothetical protein [Lachnospiraceae bacterium]
MRLFGGEVYYMGKINLHKVNVDNREDILEKEKSTNRICKSKIILKSGD